MFPVLVGVIKFDLFIPLLLQKQGKAQTALMHASFQGHIDIVRLLLDAGADKSLRDVSGTTALIHASYVGHIDIVRLLLNAGADAHLRCRRLSWTHIFRAKSRVSGCCRTLVPTS